MKAVSDNTLFEESQEHSVIYTPLWAMGLMYEGHFTEVAWCRVTAAGRDNGFSDYALRIRVDGKHSSVDKNYEAYSVARELRIAEIRKGLVAEGIIKDESTLSSGLHSEAEIAEATETIFHRVQNGEFLGQRQGTIIYVQDVAEILGSKPFVVLKTIGKVLEPEKRIGLNGMILTSWEEQEEARASLEEQTGHKDLSLSDFGGWHCAACGKHGDEYDDGPIAVECVIPEPEVSEEKKRTWYVLEKRYGHKKMSLSSFGWWSCQACGKRGDEFENPADTECIPDSE